MRFFRKKNQTEESPYIEIKKQMLNYQAANLQGIGTRKQQEDSFAFVNAMDAKAIEEQGLLAVLADGMGGLKDGKAVSERAIELLLEDFRHMNREEDLGWQLRESVYRINEILYEQFEGNAGTTLVVCIFFQRKMYFVSVGDSFLYLKRGNGIYRLNQEQTYRQELYREAVEEGRLDPALADAHPEASCLSEYLGKDRLERVDALYKPWILQDEDIVLLCSDGVGGVLSEQILLKCLKESTLECVLEQIEQNIKVQNRVHQDNYTALVIASNY